MISSIIVFFILAVPISFLRWLSKNPRERERVSGIISRNIYSAQQGVQLTAFGVRLIIYVVGYFVLLAVALVAIGGN